MRKYTITEAVGSSKEEVVRIIGKHISHYSRDGRTMIIEETPRWVGSFFHSSLILICDEKGEVVVASERLLFKYPKLFMWRYRMYVRMLRRIAGEGECVEMTNGKRHVDILTYQKRWHDWLLEKENK